jgi:glutamine phosphoribosylpyrophosphate amidotransferase
VLGADMVIYNDLEEIEDAVRSLNPTVLTTFDVSCFSGKYPTEEVHT